MTSGFGVDPTKDNNGNITSGTTSDDIRQINGGLYTPGLISGGTISTSSSAMTYTVAAGVACVQYAAGQNILIPIPATTLTLTSVPASGARTDIIYAQQRVPAVDGDSHVIVSSGPVLPPRAVSLGTYATAAGSTSSNSSVLTAPAPYAIPYGGSLGVMVRAQDTRNGVFPEAVGVTTYANNGSFTVPTDRWMSFTITAAISAADGQDGGSGGVGLCEPNFWPQLDNNNLVLWVVRANASWATYYFQYETKVTAGYHTVRLARNTFSPSGRKAQANYYGPGSHSGIILTVSDLGVAP